MPFISDQTGRPSYNQKLWRYMSLEKLLMMLKHSSLFFCRLPFLKGNDPFEGQVPPEYQLAQLEWSNRENRKKKGLPPDPEPMHQASIDLTANGHEMNRQGSCVNCWTEADDECMGMWQIYAPKNSGVVVRTDYQSLGTSILEDGWIRGHLVDYDGYKLPITGYGVSASLKKRKAFEWEDEYRLYIDLIQIADPEDRHAWYKWQMPANPPSFQSDTLQVISDDELGINVEVDLRILIHEIRLSPGSNPLFLPLIESAVLDAGLSCEVSRSALDDNLVE